MRIAKMGKLPLPDHVGFWRCSNCSTIIELGPEDREYTYKVHHYHEDDCYFIYHDCPHCLLKSHTFWESHDPDKKKREDRIAKIGVLAGITLMATYLVFLTWMVIVWPQFMMP